jgi:uncharacterized protein YbbK (DUF523 family)
MAQQPGEHNRPRIGVSRCLLGERVRYDGDSRPCRVLLDELADRFELVPVCPEVEAGLGIPRPPVQLTGSVDAPRMTGRDDPGLDVTGALLAFCSARLPILADLDGFICKSRSPSCGLATTPLFSDGREVTSTDGLFIRALREHYPRLAIIDEIALEDSTARDAFIVRALATRQARGIILKPQ